MCEPRRTARRSEPSFLTPATLLAAAVALVAMTGTGCVDQVDQHNRPARVTSIGPVNFDESALLIDYTLRDAEGDDQSLAVGICTEDEDGGVDDCATPVPGAGGDGRRSLPTTPRGEDVSHRLSWNVGCGRVSDDNQCLETDPEATYVAYVQVEDTDETVSSPPFSLADFEVDEVPDCDTSIRAIPEPCQPDDGSSQ